MGYALLIYRGGDIVGVGFYVVGRIAHGHSYAAVSQHLYIVTSIPKTDALLSLDAQSADETLNADGLAVVLVDEVAELRMPAGKSAMG
jgi:hypothetical protein